MGGRRRAYRRHLSRATLRGCGRNLAGTVTQITQGSVNATVTIDVSGQPVTSSITLEGLAEIRIQEGSAVVVLVKASDVMLAVQD